MSGFLYFLPSAAQGNISYDDLKRYGISHIVDSPKDSLIHRGCMGPENIQGVIVGAEDRWDFGQVKMNDQLTWKRFPKVVGPDGLTPWLGWYEAEGMPTPIELARLNQIPGEHLTLADGNDWLVPVARDIEGCKLPVAFDLDDETGEWVRSKVRREYAAIWKHASDYYTAYIVAAMAAREKGETVVSFNIEDGESLVVDALAVNYRVSARELASLGVLSTGIVQKVANILCDWGDSAKKKLEDNSGTE